MSRESQHSLNQTLTHCSVESISNFFHQRHDIPHDSIKHLNTHTEIETANNMPQMNNVGGCTLETCPLSMASVHYDPSLVANTFFLTFFAGMLLIQAIQAWQFKTWSYSIAIMSGLVLEIIGYVGRIQMHFNPFDPNPFLM